MKDKVTHERLLAVLDYDQERGLFTRRSEHKESLTRERLTEVLDYDKSTGRFVWKKKTAHSIVIGSEAGSIKATSTGVYRFINVDGVRYAAHRLAWLYVFGEWPRLVKAKDGDATNCAISNLVDLGTGAGVAKTDDGYLYVRIDGTDYLAARLAWFYVKGEWPEGILRFRDGNKENIAFRNLRDTGVEPAYQPTDQERYDSRRERYERERDRSRDLAFRSKFGISLAEYDQMLEAQGSACAICGKPETVERNGKPRWLAVDHCHRTGKVRGLLCGRCNPMIGYAADDAELLRKAADYVAGHNGT